jgi:glutamyl-Q tRNA(Asp) synthetase
VRIEDVDRDREVPGAADDILRTLEAFGLAWDGPVLRQSERGAPYAAALDRLLARGAAYPCSCTRGDIAAVGGPDAPYPGTCRNGPARGDAISLAWRWRVPPGPVTVEDRLQGVLTQDVAGAVGDFVLRRKDGFWSYQLAVVVDDAAQEVTDVVRGLDLWDNTPRQVLLQQALGLPSPRYLHLPLVVEPDGAKLAKTRRSVPVDAAAAPRELTRVLELLRTAPPADLAGAPVREQLDWAVAEWRPERLRGLATLPLPAPRPGLPQDPSRV